MDPWDHRKQNNIHVIGEPEEKREKGKKYYLKKKWLKTSLNWERKQTPRPGCTKRSKQDETKEIHRHLIINISRFKYKGRILKAEGKNTTFYIQGNSP